jgi:hypothetical protein
VSEERLGAAADGVIMYVSGEGWKELKVGCVFQIAPRTVPDDRIDEDEIIGSAVEQNVRGPFG